MWKSVIGYEGLYEVSDDGKVKSLPKMAGARFQTEKLSAIFETVGGYLSVNLYKNNTQKQTRVHRLVAEAFLPNPLNLPQVNHKDGDKRNNSVDNLEWCTCAENVQHAYDTGLKKGKSGEEHPMFGKHHSDSSLKKISESSKRHWERRKKNDMVL